MAAEDRASRVALPTERLRPGDEPLDLLGQPWQSSQGTRE